MATTFEELVSRITELRVRQKEVRLDISRENNALMINRMDAGGNKRKTHRTKASQLKQNLSGLYAQYAALEQEESSLLGQLYSTFGGGGSALVDQMNDTYPILFFPVRIETAFSDSDTSELWLRIFPDEIAVETHEEDLTQSEIDEGENYWRAFVDAANDEEKVHAWDLLCRSFTAQRAAWVALQTEPLNLSSDPPSDQLVFPSLTPKPDAWGRQPETRIMPDCFMIYAYPHNGNVISVQTDNIPDSLKMGIDPVLDPDVQPVSFDQETVSGRENELTANAAVDWMIDFDAAVAKGLGAKISLTSQQYTEGFKKILVLGVKSSLTASDSKTRLETLIQNHHYTDGFSLLKQGTSTNNTETDYSGYSYVEYGNHITHETERKEPLFTPVFTQKLKKDGQVLCEALGIEYDVLHHIFQSDGADISNVMNVNNVLYQAVLGYTANELMPVFGSRSSNNNELKRFFSDYIRARGALPSIRSGTQPYGILPTSVYSRIDWGTEPGTGLYKKIFDITVALDVQWTNAVAAVEDQGSGSFAQFGGGGGAMQSMSSGPSPVQQLSDILAQHAVSTEYVQRIGVGTGYIWNNLRYAAAAEEYDQLYADWKTQQMTRMGQIISESGLPLEYTHKGVQMNYLEKQSSITIPLVADADTPLDAPLPKMQSGLNMLELLSIASFDELRDENYEAHDVSFEETQKIKQTMLYRLVRQSLMLEFYEAACELLNIDEEDRKEKEFVNIVEEESDAVDLVEEEEMGRLTYGQSRLQLMASPSPYGGYDTIAALLSSESASDFPEAEQLLEAKAALFAVAYVTVRDMNLLTAELIDTVSFRFDTWRLALVNQRLNALRGITEGSSNRTTGIYLGAYGWVTDVKPSSYSPVTLPSPVSSQFEADILKDNRNKGYIHAPSVNQAATGAVMLSGYKHRANSNMESPLSVNLSSERVRAALDIMDAVRNGQELSVLLGYEFERRLRELFPDSEVNEYISALRRHYPVSGFIGEVTPDSEIVDKIKARNVVNGNKLIELYKTNELEDIIDNSGASTDINGSDAITNAINWIWNLMDAVGDIAMSEGMFHIVQGNPVKGGAVADAVSKGKLVAEPDVVRSVKSGLEVAQRFTMHFEVPDNPYDAHELPNDWGNTGIESKRWQAEPYVNRWLASLLPPPANIFCKVVAESVTEHVISLEDLHLQPVDLMYLIGEELQNDDSMFSLIIKRFVRTTYSYTKDISLEVIYTFGGDDLNESEFTFGEIHPVLLYARRLLTASRHLDTHDYISPAEADGVQKIYDTNELYNRLYAVRGSFESALWDLQDAMDANFSFTDMRNALFNLSRFGIEQTVYEFVNDETDEDEATLMGWANSVVSVCEQRLANSVLPVPPSSSEDPVPFTEQVVECMKAIFGNAFVTIPLFGIRSEEQTPLSLMVEGDSTLTDDHSNNDLLMEEWLSGIARVRKNAANYEMLTMLVGSVDFEVFNGQRQLLPLQLPYDDDDERWLGASVTTPEALKAGRVAIGACLPAEHEVTGNQAGILIDDWLDVIPSKEQITGIAFQHNQPFAKAPQSLILGLTPKITGNWQWNDLVDMMNETFELAKKRAIHYEQISSGVIGQFPGLSIPFTEKGNVIGLSAEHILS